MIVRWYIDWNIFVITFIAELNSFFNVVLNLRVYSHWLKEIDKKWHTNLTVENFVSNGQREMEIVQIMEAFEL